MAVEVVPGIWWLEGTRGCNVYLVRATDGSYALVDAAVRGVDRAIVREARAVAGDAVTHLLLTHHHVDHIGAASKVARALGLRVVIGRGDCRPAPDGGWQVEPQSKRSRVLRPIRVDVALEDRCEVLPGIEAVPVPGHTRGSTCYVHREAGVAFVGDLVISYADGLARSMVAANQHDGRYLDSLRRFAEEAPDVGLAGHGYPVRSGFRNALRELAESPREPLSARNFLRRARRIVRFTTFVWLKDQPPRR